jgi:hypothetical protein
VSEDASLGGRKAEAGTGAGGAAKIEKHHRIPRRLLAAYDGMTQGTEIHGEALQAWFNFEEMCLEHGLDPDASREELEAAVEASAVLIPYEKHRKVVHGADWPRWGRKGGLVTLARYGRPYYRFLALRRHAKITPAELRAARTAATKPSDALREKAAA